MKLKTKYSAGMRDELERLLGCPVEVVEDREANYPCKMEYARNYGRDRHVVQKDYPDAVEDMKRYLAAAAVEGAGLSHEKLLSIYPEFVVTANRRLNLLFAMKSGEVCGKKLIDAYAPTPEEIAVVESSAK